MHSSLLEKIKSMPSMGILNFQKGSLGRFLVCYALITTGSYAYQLGLKESRDSATESLRESSIELFIIPLCCMASYVLNPSKEDFTKSISKIKEEFFIFLALFLVFFFGYWRSKNSRQTIYKMVQKNKNLIK